MICIAESLTCKMGIILERLYLTYIRGCFLFYNLQATQKIGGHVLCTESGNEVA
jgi:hypothetical protein